MTLTSWNVRGYRPRAQEVDKLFANSPNDVLSISETMDGRRKDNTVDPLDFEGQVISIPGVKKKDAAGHPSMGVALLSKSLRLKRVASLQERDKNWQILVVETDRLRLIGVYAKPKMPRPAWMELLSRLDTYKANWRPTIVGGDFNAHHSAWTKGAMSPESEALRCHLRLGQTSGEPAASATAATYRLHAPAEPTCIQKTPIGITRSTIDLFLVARRGNHMVSDATLLVPLGVGGSDHAPIALTLQNLADVDTRPRLQFLPTPNRIANSKHVAVARAHYAEKLTPFATRLDQCTSSTQLTTITTTL